MKLTITLWIIGALSYALLQNVNFLADGLTAIEAVKQVATDSASVAEAQVKMNLISIVKTLLNCIPLLFLVLGGLNLLRTQKEKQPAPTTALTK